MLLLSFFLNVAGVFSFVPPISNAAKGIQSFPSRLFLSSDEIDLSAKFTALIRDLQIENVPILGCEADDPSSFSGALWTTISEMSENNNGDKACLVLENTSMAIIETVVKDFSLLKSEDCIMKCLPELRRVDMRLLGVGPAIVIETSKRTIPEKIQREACLQQGEDIVVEKCHDALQHFANRMQLAGDEVNQQATRSSRTTDAFGALAMFWTCICELQSVPDAELSHIALSLPGIAMGRSDASHDRFSAFAEVVSRSLVLLRSHLDFELLHLHPAYDRKLVVPEDDIAHGHLPPHTWLPQILRLNNGKEAGENFTPDQLNLLNYQRRSPQTAIFISKVKISDKSVVNLDLGDEKVVEMNNVERYAVDLKRMLKEGEESLEKFLEEEICMTK